MNLYQIIGLKKTTIEASSYETNYNNYILTNENGIGISKTHTFTYYIIYILFEKSYYAIHLYQQDCASFSGKLCNIGMIKMSYSNHTDFHSNITHFPIKPLFVPANFELKEDNYYGYDLDQMEIFLYNEPNIIVFKYSSIGNDEKEPSGYVYVNIDLFTNIDNIISS